MEEFLQNNMNINMVYYKIKLMYNTFRQRVKEFYYLLFKNTAYTAMSVAYCMTTSLRIILKDLQ